MMIRQPPTVTWTPGCPPGAGLNSVPGCRARWARSCRSWSVSSARRAGDVARAAPVTARPRSDGGEVRAAQGRVDRSPEDPRPSAGVLSAMAKPRPHRSRRAPGVVARASRVTFAGTPPVTWPGRSQTMTVMAGTSWAGWRGTASLALFWLGPVGRYVRGASGLPCPLKAAMARLAMPGTIGGDYALESGTTSCMVPACLRQPAGNQDLLPGARSPLFAPAGEDTVSPRQQPVSHPGSSADGFVGRLVCHGQHAGVPRP